MRGYSALEFHFSCMYQQPWVQKDCLPRALYPRSQQSSEMGQLLVTSQTRLANKTVRQAVKRSTSVHPRQQRINLFKRCCSFCSGSLMRKKKKKEGSTKKQNKAPTLPTTQVANKLDAGLPRKGDCSSGLQDSQGSGKEKENEITTMFVSTTDYTDISMVRTKSSTTKRNEQHKPHDCPCLPFVCVTDND